jgi:hypothetical protein
VKTQFTEELRQIIRELQEWVIELG